VAQGLRKADIEEIEGLGRAPYAALAHSIAVTAPHTMTVVSDDLPVAVFGVVRTEHEGRFYGSPWFLGTDGIYTVAREFARQTIHWVNWMNAQYPTLMNVMSDSNRLSKRWLRNAGFTVHPPRPLGVDGKLYCPFTRERK
jgi:hypothetical protein